MTLKKNDSVLSAFDSVDSCISLIQNALSHFSNIALLVTDSDYSAWHTMLSGKANIRDFLFGTDQRLNFLNLSAMVAFDLVSSEVDHLGSPFVQMISNLDKWLGQFPELTKSESFKVKLYNPAAYSFPATMSELSIASAFRSLGFKITFETAFKQVSNGKNRDVDITVVDSHGNKMHIEVYMPHEQAVFDGFFDVDSGNANFKFKVERKLDRKFGSNGISGLNGAVLLAVNIAFFDQLLVNSALPFLSNDGIYLDLKKNLATGIDGLLFFRDGFTRSIPFLLEQLMIKVPPIATATKESS